MTLAGTYIVYGYVYNKNGIPANNATVTILDLIDNQGTEIFTTGVDGYYQINIQNIASDGDDILVEAELASGYVYGECFTLNLYEPPKRIDMTVEEYPYIEIESDTYSIKLRFCTIESPNRDINKDISVINFWNSEDIRTVDEDLSSEPFNLSGIEYAKLEKEVCYIARKIELINKIMDLNEEVIVTAFNDCFNDVYVIRNFEINSIKECPNAYKWNMDLERVRDV